MSTCPKCKSSNITEGYGGCNLSRLCNDCDYYWNVNDPENGRYLTEEEKNASKKKGGGCCGKGAKQECDKEKEEEEEQKKKKGGGCCGKGAKGECNKQQEPTPTSPPSIKAICAQLPALVNPLVPSGAEISNFVTAIIDDYNAISSVTYPPSCSQLKSVAGLVTKYSSFVPSFA